MSYVRKQLEQAAAEGKPQLPTYQAVANVLERKNGSGIRLVGWTVARTCLILPGMLAVGVPLKKAFIGSMLSSSLISILALVRVYNAGFQEDAERWAKMKREQRLGRWERRSLGRWDERRERQIERFSTHRKRLTTRKPKSKHVTIRTFS